MDLATRKMVYYGLIGLLVAGSAIAVFRMAPPMLRVPFLAKDGTLAVYWSSIPSDIKSNQSGSNLAAQPLSLNSPLRQVLVSVNVTVDSISFHDSEGNDTGWTTDSLQNPVTIDLLKPSSVSALIGSVETPTQDVTMVVLHVSKAVASVTVNGVLSTSPVNVTVRSNTLKVPINPGARVDAQMTTKVVVGRPHIVITGNNAIKVTPVLNVESNSNPDS